jgi:hypothetical protein
MKVIPHPQLNDEMEAAYIRAVGEYTKLIATPTTLIDRIVLGADPEFVMLSKKGNLLIASRYFPRNGKVGYDAIWIGQNRSNKPVAEIRPSPSTDPQVLVVRIYQSLYYAAKKMEHISSKWLAGSMPYQGFPLGGHIHFSGIQPNFKMLRAFDNYLALPFVIVEDTQSSRKRRPQYGFLGDFRFQEHGGFEYRTLPSWLVSPTLTKGVFALAKLIAAHYDQLQLDPLSDPEVQKAYYAGEKETLRKWFEVLWADLERLDNYERYKKFLDGFYRFIVSGNSWSETRDIRRYWRVPPFTLKKS